jgi:hypothetical protein
MHGATTTQAIADITDEGLFERLATAVLRDAEPDCRNLVHPGVNAGGKTVKSPLDGIHFAPGADPPHLIAIHHTTTGIDNLEGKWLHDPSKVKPRKGPKPTAPAGDLLKTAEILTEERTRRPDLRATLILTTNQEPGESLVRKVKAQGESLGIEVKFWTRSGLTHFLDNTSQGQWLRHSYLGVEQELLSEELLGALSERSLTESGPRDLRNARVVRALDRVLVSALNRNISFVVGESGFGKSVACHQRLLDHVAQGGYALIVRHQTVSDELTIEHAIAATLRQLHPSLAVASPAALSFCSPERPLLLLIEDLNKSGQSQVLIERLAAWCQAGANSNKEQKPLAYRILCPLWPQVLALLDEQTRKAVEASIVTADRFTDDEARDAVLALARAGNSAFSPLKAEEIARALGNDPLLISLHDTAKPPEPHKVIGQYIEGTISRAAKSDGSSAPADYRQALKTLATEMLLRKQEELTWTEVSTWPSLEGERRKLLGQLAHRGDLLAFTGSSDAQRLSFRHDRVREWLLADVICDLDHQDRLNEDVLGDPYFAEVFGAALVFGHAKPDFLDRVARLNPLALFYALKYWGPVTGATRDSTLQAIRKWLSLPDTRGRANTHLRWEALAALAETDSNDIPALVLEFPDRVDSGRLARLRNGDLCGGIELCAYLEPGVTAPWRDAQIEHAKLRYRGNLTRAVDSFLRRDALSDGEKTGALRLAGHIADPALAEALEHCWQRDEGRVNRLADYLWSLAQCCTNDPVRFLGPSCDVWASLPDAATSEGSLSPRDYLAGDQLRWAFSRWPPVAALDFFIQRASDSALRWPITAMMHGIDHPKAVVFVARELAATGRQLEGTDSFSPFGLSAPDEWRRAQEKGRPMSQVSREALQQLWMSTPEDKHLRREAFRLWSGTQHPTDIGLLQNLVDTGPIADLILAQRLRLGDKQAIPALIEKLSGRGLHSYWWQWCRYIWSPDLTEALEKYLERRRAEKTWTWGLSAESDWIVSEMLMRLPNRESERLLLRHWDHLHFSPQFVQAALYATTQLLEEAAASAIKECPEPAHLLVHVTSHFGIRVQGRAGITRREQVRALSPYMSLMSPLNIKQLWDLCRDRGWLDLSRDVVGAHLKPPFTETPRSSAVVAAEFDKMIAERRVHWISLWIDRTIAAGVTWDEILSALKSWFAERKSFDALQIVAAALVYRGSRRDLNTLRIYDGMPADTSKQLIVDTDFAVRRRTVR